MIISRYPVWNVFHCCFIFKNGITGLWESAMVTDEQYSHNPAGEWLGWFATMDNADNYAKVLNENNTTSLEGLSKEHQEEIEQLISKYRQQDKLTELEKASNKYAKDNHGIKYDTDEQYEELVTYHFYKDSFKDGALFIKSKWQNYIHAYNNSDIIVTKFTNWLEEECK